MTDARPETAAIEPPSLARIAEVRAALESRLLRTPLVRWPDTSPVDGADVQIKLELLQRAGSFKARGALNSLLALEAPARGVVAFSAGNHAIATAWAGRELGVDVTVVMPRSANPARVARVEALGATLVFRATVADLVAEVERIERDEGRAVVHPFEGPRVVEGTATLGAELLDQGIAEDAEPDIVIVPIGGGGLAAGVAAAIGQRRPRVRVIGVEPAGADGMRRSLAAGAPLARVSVDTIADSLGAPLHLPLTYALVERFVERIVTVDDAALRRAMRRMFDTLKLAVEPACAAALAGLEALAAEAPGALEGQRIALIACGSNIDAAGWARLVGAGGAGR